MYLIAKTAVENAAYAFDKLYSYLVPEEFREQIQPGCRVTIPFGRGNQKRTGVVVELEEARDRDRLKPLQSLVDEQPLLNEEGLHLLRYLKEHTFCTWFDALRVLIPTGLGIVHKTLCKTGPNRPEALTQTQEALLAYLGKKRKPLELEPVLQRFELHTKSKEFLELVEQGAVELTQQQKQRILDERICMVRLVEDAVPDSLTPKQKKVLTFLEETETASLKEICYYTGVTRAVVDNLKAKGIVEYDDEVQLRDPYAGSGLEIEESAVLTPEQQAAYEALRGYCDEEGPAPALLHGITGSGKTQVFLKLIEYVRQKGQSVIVLVPEISLTAQAVEGFRRRFGSEVAVLHSGLSLGERMDQWRRIRSGDAPVVVGTRSAVFAPLENIGLIVIDEEQEHTYQSEKAPRFHARDVALRRCGWHGALLLLASATPSVESYYQATQNRYRLLTLEKRYNQTPLPDVYVVDMKDAQNLSLSPSISSVLLEELRYNLEHGEQSILLLNRRGYSTVIKCSSCATVAECPNCSVALTYHSANDGMICHYCGYTRGKDSACAGCGSEMIRYSGAGTQKLEEELGEFFPDARILRIDMDTTMTKFSHQRLFTAFARGEYDIMIGTQMVAKGLNFPGVTLVGVLSADQSLYAGDFRSFERSFSLLTQVVGRCGRGEKRGRAFVQTFSPETPIIQLAARQDYRTFFSGEIRSRKLHLYPPFCTMAGIGFVSEHLSEVQKWSKSFLQELAATASREYPKLPIRVLGPVPSDILKAAGKYRYKLIVKCRNSPETRALFTALLQWFYGACKTVTCFIDMHYDRI